MCVSELRFGGVKPMAGEATCCIDMAKAPEFKRVAIPCCPRAAKINRFYPAKLRRYH
jgi:hypothetical protein